MGRPAHHPRMLLKIILFAYTRSTYSGRKIVQLNEENIPMQWLSQQTYVCYHVINNFRSNEQFSSIIKNIFVYFTLLLQHYHIIDSDSLFIDGTKVQADANRYSFVWRKAVERYDEALNEKAVYQGELIADASKISLSQFSGIELDDFAHEVARLSLYIAEHQMNVEMEEALAEALADASALLDAFCVCDEQAAILKASTPIPRTLIRFFFITFSFFMFIKL